MFAALVFSPGLGVVDEGAAVALEAQGGRGGRPGLGEEGGGDNEQVNRDEKCAMYGTVYGVHSYSRSDISTGSKT